MQILKGGEDGWGQLKKNNDFFICQMSCLNITCHMLTLTYHRSLTPTATATDPPPAKFPTIQSRLVCKDPTTKKYFKTQIIMKMANIQKPLEVCQY